MLIFTICIWCISAAAAESQETDTMALRCEV